MILKYLVWIYSVLLALIFTAQPISARVTTDRDLQRWLGKKPDIGRIEIEGNRFFTNYEVKTVLFSKTSNIFRKIKSDRRRKVQRETQMRDTAEVKYLYLSHGFLGVQVTEQFIPILPDSNVLVKIAIAEGRQFLYRYVRFDGEYEDEFGPVIRNHLKRFKVGHPADPFELKQAAYDIKSSLANQGHPYATVVFRIDSLPDRLNIPRTPRRNRDDSITTGFADIYFDIKTDSLVYFGEVRVTGADHFNPSLVRRELTFKKGDIYRRDDIIKSQKRLLETGYYLTLHMYPTSGDTASLYARLNPDFSLRLKEKKTHYVSLKTGAAQDSLRDLTWTLSASWGKRNLFRSRHLELTASSSFIIFTEWRVKEHTYRVRVTEPWFFNIRMPLTVTGQLSPGVRTSVLDQDYRKESWSISISTTRWLQERTRINTGLQYESVNIYGLSEEDRIQLKQDEGIRIRRKLFFDIIRDTRNNIFIPSTGSLTSLHLDYVGGFLSGDDSFILLEASWSRYQRTWPGWISAFRLKGGYVREFGESERVPLDDRFYLGGANTVRGFAENNLGPKLQEDDGTLKPEGANIVIIANQEFRYRIIGKFWGSLFGDFGNGFRNRDEIDLESFAISYGMGLQFLSPAGPIRIDYARRVGTKSIRPGDRFHFTILYAF